MSKKVQRRNPNWRVEGAGRPEWSFHADGAESAHDTARTFTRWDLEHRGQAGEFEIRVTDLAAGTSTILRVVVGRKETRQHPIDALASAA